VGSEDALEVRNIVGAIANETCIRSRFIWQIRIHPKYSTVELPDDVPQKIVEHLRTTMVAGKPMKMSRSRGGQAFPSGNTAAGARKAKPGRPKAGNAQPGKPKKAKPKKAKTKKPRGPKK